MTGRDRIARILKHQPTDRIGLFEHFWEDTCTDYVARGYMKEGENPSEHFGLDIDGSWAFNLTADLDFVPQTIREDADTITVLDGNGAVLRRHKHHDTTPEHVDFTVKERPDWDLLKPKLLLHPERRIHYDAYREKRAASLKSGRFFTWNGVNAFESIHPVCGHENLLVGMLLDPAWIQDMALTYTQLHLELYDMLFEREGYPDGLFIYEDMGFKEKPFMSPKMYKELIFPSHQAVINYAHSKGLPVIMHSCGFIEPLLPYMIEAGIDCLQVIEIKAGMDLLRIHKQFGDKIALMGGVDVRTLYSNDRRVIDAELEAKIPIVKQGYGYVAHSDHSIPKTVLYDTLRYYMDKVLELGRY